MNFFYRPFYWSYRIASRLWSWGRRRFTFAGAAVLVFWLISGAVGVDFENTVSYQAFVLLTALLLVAGAGSVFFRARFSITRLLPRLGTAGQPLRYRVRLKNLTAKKQAGLALIENLAEPRPSFADWTAFQRAEERRLRPFRYSPNRTRNPFRPAAVREAAIPSMLPGDEADALIEIFPLRRGVLHLQGIIVARPDPLGIFRSLVRVAVPQSILILPRRYHLPAINLPGAMRYQKGGVALATHVGSSEEFVALRDYRHGDPLRHIHWRSWAKVGRPIVKEFEDEFFVRHALVLDTFDAEPNSVVLEEAVSVAASFACNILTQESLLDLLFVGNQSYCFTAGRGLAYADQMLEILASVRNCADQPFATLERLVMNHISVVSGCICVLQRWDDARKNLVEKLKALDVPLMVMIIVPPESREAIEANFTPADREILHVLEVGKIQEELRKLR